VDGTVKLWYTRKGKTFAASITAHDIDVNVISWNHKRAFLLASGCDDGGWKVWDLRKLGDNMTYQFRFNWHKDAITSIEWNPNDDSEIAVSSADNSVSIWDLSLTIEKTKVDELDIPSQLLFVHRGQENIKEVHWHPQIPGTLISTAVDGFNIFKPSNISTE
jgi:ribosome assembly protein RRB1